MYTSKYCTSRSFLDSPWLGHIVYRAQRLEYLHVNIFSTCLQDLFIDSALSVPNRFDRHHQQQPQQQQQRHPRTSFTASCWFCPKLTLLLSSANFSPLSSYCCCCMQLLDFSCSFNYTSFSGKLTQAKLMLRFFFFCLVLFISLCCCCLVYGLWKYSGGWCFVSRGFHSIYIDSVVPSFPPLELYLDFTLAANSVPRRHGVESTTMSAVSPLVYYV